MDLSTEEPRLSQGDRRRNASYLKQFVPGMIGYVVSITVVSSIVGDEPSTSDRLLALLPLLPSLWVVWAVVRMIRRSDEMTRTVHYQSMAVGFGGAMVAALATGLFTISGDSGLFGRLAPWLIFGVGMLTWATSAGIISARRS